MGDNQKPRPDVQLDVGYDIKKQQATFSIGISNVFGAIGKRTFGFPYSMWRTRGKGKSDAKLSLPAATATTPEGRESEVRIARDQQCEKIDKHLNLQIERVRNWLEDHSPVGGISVDRILQDVDAKVDEVIKYYHRRFEETRENLQASFNEYVTFKQEHGLTRRAEVPLFFLAPIVTLLAAMLFETIANAFIFAGISSQGMIGGWAMAVIISVVNIVLGLTMGLLFIRYALYWTDWRRWLMIAGAIMLAVVIAFFNLYAAHFREVAEAAILNSQSSGTLLSRDRAPSFQDAWPHFIQNPLNLGSILSIALLLIGIVIALYATYKGYRGFTDPYPGYGRRGKRFYIDRLKREMYEDVARELCYRVLDNARAGVERSWSLHAHFKSEVEKTIAHLSTLQNAARNAEVRINNNAWTLISAYRNANNQMRAKLKRRARKPNSKVVDPGPAPSYFARDPRSETAWTSSSPEVERCRNEAKVRLTLIESNLKALELAKSRISSMRKGAGELVLERMDSDDRKLRDAIELEMNPQRPSLKVVEARA